MLDRASVVEFRSCECRYYGRLAVEQFAGQGVGEKLECYQFPYWPVEKGTRGVRRLSGDKLDLFALSNCGSTAQMRFESCE